jgi:ATP-dependent DNA ligase
VAKKPLPEFVAPMTASSVKQAFDSSDWIFETKLDGYRAIAVIDSTGKARIWSRNRLPLEQKFPTVGEAVNQLKLRSTILDGEIVALDEEGIPPVPTASEMAKTARRTSCLLPVRPPLGQWPRLDEKECCSTSKAPRRESSARSPGSR